jgi:hypothetical protein
MRAEFDCSKVARVFECWAVAQVQALPLPIDVASPEQRFYCPLIIRTRSDLAPVCASTVKMFPTPGA